MKLIRYVVILIDRLSWILTCLDKIGSLSSSTLLRHPTDVPIKNKINKIVLFNISNHFSWLDLTKPELNFNDRRLNFRTDTLAHLFRVMWLRWTLKKTSGRNEQFERTNEVSADKVLSVLKEFIYWRNHCMTTCTFYSSACAIFLTLFEQKFAYKFWAWFLKFWIKLNTIWCYNVVKCKV